MKKLTLILIILACLSNLYAQNFKANSIGAVRLEKVVNDTLFLGVVFPSYFLSEIPKEILDNPYSLLENKEKRPNNEFEFSKSLIIANETGIIYESKDIDTYKIIFWCENDGPVAVAPYFKLKIHKNDYKANYNFNESYDKYISVAIINYQKELIDNPVVKSDRNILLKADINGDGNLEAYIWGEPDEAMGGLCINLSFEDRYYNINCCGP